MVAQTDHAATHHVFMPIIVSYMHGVVAPLRKVFSVLKHAQVHHNGGARERVRLR
jgi:hypothetical protein